MLRYIFKNLPALSSKTEPSPHRYRARLFRSLSPVHRSDDKKEPIHREIKNASKRSRSYTRLGNIKERPTLQPKWLPKLKENKRNESQVRSFHQKQKKINRAGQEKPFIGGSKAEDGAEPEKCTIEPRFENKFFTSEKFELEGTQPRKFERKMSYNIIEKLQKLDIKDVDNHDYLQPRNIQPYGNLHSYSSTALKPNHASNAIVTKIVKDEDAKEIHTKKRKKNDGNIHRNYSTISYSSKKKQDRPIPLIHNLPIGSYNKSANLVMKPKKFPLMYPEGSLSLQNKEVAEEARRKLGDAKSINFTDQFQESLQKLQNYNLPYTQKGATGTKKNVNSPSPFVKRNVNRFSSRSNISYDVRMKSSLAVNTAPRRTNTNTSIYYDNSIDTFFKNNIEKHKVKLRTTKKKESQKGNQSYRLLDINLSKQEQSSDQILGTRLMPKQFQPKVSAVSKKITLKQDFNVNKLKNKNSFTDLELEKSKIKSVLGQEKLKQHIPMKTRSQITKMSNVNKPLITEKIQTLDNKIRTRYTLYYPNPIQVDSLELFAKVKFNSEKKPAPQTSEGISHNKSITESLRVAPKSSKSILPRKNDSFKTRNVSVKPKLAQLDPSETNLISKKEHIVLKMTDENVVKHENLLSSDKIKTSDFRYSREDSARPIIKELKSISEINGCDSKKGSIQPITSCHKELKQKHVLSTENSKNRNYLYATDSVQPNESKIAPNSGKVQTDITITKDEGLTKTKEVKLSDLASSIEIKTNDIFANKENDISQSVKLTIQKSSIPVIKTDENSNNIVQGNNDKLDVSKANKIQQAETIEANYTKVHKDKKITSTSDHSLKILNTKPQSSTVKKSKDTVNNLTKPKLYQTLSLKKVKFPFRMETRKDESKLDTKIVNTEKLKKANISKSGCRACLEIQPHNNNLSCFIAQSEKNQKLFKTVFVKPTEVELLEYPKTKEKIHSARSEESKKNEQHSVNNQQTLPTKMHQNEEHKANNLKRDHKSEQLQKNELMLSKTSESQKSYVDVSKTTTVESGDNQNFGDTAEQFNENNPEELPTELPLNEEIQLMSKKTEKQENHTGQHLTEMAKKLMHFKTDDHVPIQLNSNESTAKANMQRVTAKESRSSRKTTQTTRFSKKNLKKPEKKTFIELLQRVDVGKSLPKDVLALKNTQYLTETAKRIKTQNSILETTPKVSLLKTHSQTEIPTQQLNDKDTDVTPNEDTIPKGCRLSQVLNEATKKNVLHKVHSQSFLGQAPDVHESPPNTSVECKRDGPFVKLAVKRELNNNEFIPETSTKHTFEEQSFLEVPPKRGDFQDSQIINLSNRPLLDIAKSLIPYNPVLNAVLIPETNENSFLQKNTDLESTTFKNCCSVIPKPEHKPRSRILAETAKKILGYLTEYKALTKKQSSEEHSPDRSENDHKDILTLFVEILNKTNNNPSSQCLSEVWPVKKYPTLYNVISSNAEKPLTAILKPEHENLPNLVNFSSSDISNNNKDIDYEDKISQMFQSILESSPLFYSCKSSQISPDNSSLQSEPTVTATIKQDTFFTESPTLVAEILNIETNKFSERLEDSKYNVTKDIITDDGLETPSSKVPANIFQCKEKPIRNEQYQVPINKIDLWTQGYHSIDKILQKQIRIKNKLMKKKYPSNIEACFNAVRLAGQNITFIKSISTDMGSQITKDDVNSQLFNIKSNRLGDIKEENLSIGSNRDEKIYPKYSPNVTNSKSGANAQTNTLSKRGYRSGSNQKIQRTDMNTFKKLSASSRHLNKKRASSRKPPPYPSFSDSVEVHVDPFTNSHQQVWGQKEHSAVFKQNAKIANQHIACKILTKKFSTGSLIKTSKLVSNKTKLKNDNYKNVKSFLIRTSSHNLTKEISSRQFSTTSIFSSLSEKFLKLYNLFTSRTMLFNTFGGSSKRNQSKFPIDKDLENGSEEKKVRFSVGDGYKSKAPYPAFTECLKGELAANLSECPIEEERIKYLQPQHQLPFRRLKVAKPIEPAIETIDLSKEEDCVRAKLCLKNEGLTETCNTFGKLRKQIRQRDYFEIKDRCLTRIDANRRFGERKDFCTYAPKQLVYSANCFQEDKNVKVPLIGLERNYHFFCRKADRKITEKNEIKSYLKKELTEDDDCDTFMKLRNLQWRIDNFHKWHRLNRLTNFHSSMIKRYYSMNTNFSVPLLRLQEYQKCYILSNHKQMLECKSQFSSSCKPSKVFHRTEHIRKQNICTQTKACSVTTFENIKLKSDSSSFIKLRLNSNKYQGYDECSCIGTDGKQLQPKYPILPEIETVSKADICFPEHIDANIKTEYMRHKYNIDKSGITLECKDFEEGIASGKINVKNCFKKKALEQFVPPVQEVTSTKDICVTKNEEFCDYPNPEFFIANSHFPRRTTDSECVLMNSSDCTKTPKKAPAVKEECITVDPPKLPKMEKPVKKEPGVWEKIVAYFKARPNCPSPDEWKKRAAREKAERYAKAAGLCVCDPNQLKRDHRPQPKKVNVCQQRTTLKGQCQELPRVITCPPQQPKRTVSLFATGNVSSGFSECRRSFSTYQINTKMNILTKYCNMNFKNTRYAFNTFSKQDRINNRNHLNTQKQHFYTTTRCEKSRKSKTDDTVPANSRESIADNIKECFSTRCKKSEKFKTEDAISTSSRDCVGDTFKEHVYTKKCERSEKLKSDDNISTSSREHIGDTFKEVSQTLMDAENENYENEVKSNNGEIDDKAAKSTMGNKQFSDMYINMMPKRCYSEKSRNRNIDDINRTLEDQEKEKLAEKIIKSILEASINHHHDNDEVEEVHSFSEYDDIKHGYKNEESLNHSYKVLQRRTNLSDIMFREPTDEYTKYCQARSFANFVEGFHKMEVLSNVNYEDIEKMKTNKLVNELNKLINENQSDK